MSTEILSRVRLFAGLTADELTEIFGTMRSLRVKAGEVVFSQHEIGDTAYVVQEGQVEVLTPDGDGDIQLATIEPGEVVGELALVDGAVRSATVRATQDSILLRLYREDFDAMRQAYRPAAAKVLRQIARTVCQRLRETNARLVHLAESGLQVTPVEMQRTPAPKTRRTHVTELVDQAIDAIALFEDLDGPTRTLLSRHVKVCKGGQGDLLFEEGDPGDRCYIPVVGTVAVTKQLPWNAEDHLATLGPGTLVGHLALIDNQPRSATCRVATRKGVFLVIGRAAFEQLFDAEAAFAYSILYRIVRDLVVRQRNATARLEELERVHAADDRRFNLHRVATALVTGERPVLTLAEDGDPRWSAEGLEITRGHN